MKLSEKQKRLKQEFQQEKGYWSQALEQLLMFDENFFEVYTQFISAPERQRVLEPKIQELISIAINASTTHLYESRLRFHIQQALSHGATKEEILEVLQLTSVLGMHTCALGVRVLYEQAGDNEYQSEEELTEKQKRLKAEFIEQMRYWSSFRDKMLTVNEDYFEAYLRLITHPWKKGVLAPKVKEFIYIAIDSSTTHLYERGLRIHVQNALKYGATVEEIMEVYELTSIQGMHTIEFGITILAEELEKLENMKNM